MFLKPFKPKSNVQLKGSESKKLKSKLCSSFPNATEDDIQKLLPSKANVTHLKLITFVNSSCNVYCVDKRPIIFEDSENQIVPTVYALWLVPDLIPYFTTHPNVLPRLSNGADLMLPGVIRKGDGLNAFGHFKKDQLVAVNLTSNKASIGVGRLARSSYDLYMSGGHGHCVNMLHVFGDKLWSLEPSVTLQVPELGPVISVPSLVDNSDFPDLNSPKKSKNKNVSGSFASVLASMQNNTINESSGNVNNDVKQEENENVLETEEIPRNDNDKEEDKIEQHEERTLGNHNCNLEETMDNILFIAFLKAIKYHGKDLQLPLLTSNFYRLHVIPAARKQIDLKQTKYKKISKFLNEMCERGFLTVKEESKGIEKIISINFDHPELVNFIPSENSGSDQENNNGAGSNLLFHTEMAELYMITDETILFFTKMNLRKGESITNVQVKKFIKEYISKNKLPTVAERTKYVELDETLRTVCGKEKCTSDEIYRIILSKMNHTYEMRSKNELLTGNKPPIQLSLATRSGNKKVTLVSNLEAYGIIISEFAKACKLGAAASTSIVKMPGQKSEQFQIQGNQVRFLHTLLTETYKIPAKNIHGLDLAKKEKKKKS